MIKKGDHFVDEQIADEASHNKYAIVELKSPTNQSWNGIDAYEVRKKYRKDEGSGIFSSEKIVKRVLHDPSAFAAAETVLGNKVADIIQIYNLVKKENPNEIVATFLVSPDKIDEGQRVALKEKYAALLEEELKQKDKK